MSPGDLNFAWARAILSALAECGIEEVEIAPGSRSGPLVLASRSLPDMNARVHLDERCAAFFALGYGRTHLAPAAVITTSGTAVANLLPAVVEADMSDVPMVLITADRPPRLRGADANQTITQPGIFGGRVRFEADLPVPSPAELAGTHPNSPREIARRAARQALGPPSGPVHLNVPFDKPLEPASPEGLGLAGHGRTPSLHSTGGAAPKVLRRGRSERRRRGRGQEAVLAGRLQVARRPLLVAGPSADPGLDGPAIARFAVVRGVPTFADPLSGVRFDRVGGITFPSPILGAYHHYLRLPAVIARYAPDLIIRAGRTPTSAVLEAALAGWSASVQVVIDDGAHRKDHQGLAHHYLHASAAAVLGGLAGNADPNDIQLPTPTSWTRVWTSLEATAWAAIDAKPPRHDHEGEYAAALVRALPFGATLFVSSSMPVRDVDAYARPAPCGLQVLGNRGASGIDGVVSTVLGCAAGGAWPMAALVGDIALYHDMNGLLAARDRELNVVFVVVDNDGGGIFHMLPIRNFEPVFTPYFATPHGLDFRHAAQMYGLPFTDVTAPGELQDAVAAAVARPGTEIIRVRTDRDANRLRHEEVRERVTRHLQGFLNR